MSIEVNILLISIFGKDSKDFKCSRMKFMQIAEKIFGRNIFLKVTYIRASFWKTRRKSDSNI